MPTKYFAVFISDVSVIFSVILQSFFLINVLAPDLSSLKNLRDAAKRSITVLDEKILYDIGTKSVH